MREEHHSQAAQLLAVKACRGVYRTHLQRLWTAVAFGIRSLLRQVAQLAPQQVLLLLHQQHLVTATPLACLQWQERPATLL